MKKKLFLLAISAIATFQLFGQQFSGKTSYLSVGGFGYPIESGFFHCPASSTPATTWPYQYRYLMNIRLNTTDGTLQQFQISTGYVDDDQVFFRKIYPYGASVQAPWHEFATRGVNKFKGNQYITGTLYANEIKVETTSWADFVFASDYNLRPLSEVKSHIENFRHLPDIPSEAEVIENGIELSDMTRRLLQKVEELTLYVIQQDEKIKELSDKLSEVEDLNK